MKKKVVAMLMVLTLGVTCFYNLGVNVKAADEAEEAANYSAFQAVDALVGDADVGICGVYLGSGHSIINKISSVKVGAGGITNASMLCRVSTNAILEKLDGGSWVRFNSWTTTVEVGYSAGVDKTDIVDKGYYYRVRCIHRAGTDRSSSYTSNLWM